MMRCAACPASAGSFVTEDELEVHIASDHVNYVPYECERCRFSKFPTEYALVSHCTNDHGLKEFYVKYKVTPETDRKRQQVKELLQKSLTLSDNIGHVRPQKRKRASAVEVVHSSTSALSPCSSLDSEENVRLGAEIEKVKAELAKEDAVCEAEESSVEKDVGGQHVIVAATGEITLAGNKFSNIASGLTDVFPTDGRSIFDVGLKSFDPLVDISQSFLSSQEGSSQNPPKKRRPPRTCNECGLQVTGQRSSLVYHANSKHLRLPLFHCRPCNKTWSTVTKSDIIKHVKAVHNGDDSGIVDYRSQYTSEIREMTDRCFPPKHKGGNDEEEADGSTNVEALLWLNNEDTPLNTV